MGDRVFVYNPSKKQGKMQKLARTFEGPYHVLKLHPNGAGLQLISKPRATTFRIALNQIRLCPKEIEESLAMPPQTKVDNDTSSKTIKERRMKERRLQTEKKQIHVEMNMAKKKKWIFLSFKKPLSRLSMKQMLIYRNEA